MSVALNGLLNIHKPTGWTSRDVVNRIERLVKPSKGGHAGTLDPLAEGVLIVCVGSATRLLQYVQADIKEYIAEFELGARSDTDDNTGTVTRQPEVTPVERVQLEAVLPQFLGEIQQIPPQFSAIHVQGRRAYQLARAGETVELAARTVRIDELELLAVNWPIFKLRVVCSAGTYIRSLGRDLGELLGCGAMMTSLVRTRIGEYQLSDATPIDDLNRDNVAAAVQSPLRAISHWPQHVCTPVEVWDLAHGRAVKQHTFPVGTLVALVDAQGELIATGQSDPERGIRPLAVFVKRDQLTPPEPETPAAE